MGRRAEAVAVALVFAFGTAAGLAQGEPPNREHAVLSSVDLRFATQGPAPRGDTVEARARDFVRERMRHDEFYAEAIPFLFSGTSVNTTVVAKRIVGARTGGVTVHFLAGQKPCAAADAVLVRPWWKMSEPIRVCKDSYRPEVDSETSHGATQYCERMLYNEPTDACRCGRHLVNCAPDEIASKLTTEAQLEVLQTARAIISTRQPLSKLLTTHDTVRSGLGDFFYRRARFLASGDEKELTEIDITAPPAWRPRRPEFHGGVLTTPQYLYFDDARRIVMTKIWDDFLCVPLRSSNVDTQQMLHASDGHLRGQDVFALATTVGCQDCHARLENGMRAFRGFTMGHAGERFVPAATFTGTVSLHVGGASDRRESGPSNPEWLAGAIARQPEHKDCVVRRTEALVFAGEPVPTTVHRALLASFSQKEDFADLVEETVIARVKQSAPAR